jgi:hypothetical protein
MVISGSPPLWSIKYQYEDGGSWIDLHTESVDFRSHLSPPLDEIGLVLSAFSGATTNKPGVLPTTLPDRTIWFREFEVSQFEPWIVDRSLWTIEAWVKNWQWLTGIPYTPEYISSAEDPLARPRIPHTDLMHSPIGTAGEPEELRYSDPDLGICVKLGINSKLFAVGVSDNRLIEIVPDALPIPLAVCDLGLYGPDAPCAFYFRGKFEGMESWATDRNIISCGDVFNGSPTDTDNGIGLYWKSTGVGTGYFVLRTYQTGIGWFDIDFNPIELDGYTDTPIDIGFAWTGARGVSIGRDNYELRLVVNGVTKASSAVPGMGVVSGGTCSVGATGSSDGFTGLMRYCSIYGSAVTDQDLLNAFDGFFDPFSNESFEIEDDTQRPGEAEHWVWNSSQSEVAWANFNAYDSSLVKWHSDTEDFGAGFFFPYSYTFADEAERVAFGLTLTADDIGNAGHQVDSNTMWIWTEIEETGVPPYLGWLKSTAGTNENWVDEYEQVIAAIFNIGATLYESTVEEFTIWGSEPTDPFTWTGPPWRDDWVFIQPSEEPGGATGFDSWYDDVYGTSLMALEKESFGEAWGNDPFSTCAGPMWHPGSSHDGRILGASIEFPVQIPPDSNTLVMYNDYTGLVELSLDVGEYQTIVELATMLQSKWSPFGFTGMVFGYEEFEDGSHITFGADKSYTMSGLAGASMFGYRAERQYNDARGILGLETFGPRGMKSEMTCRHWMLGNILNVPEDEVYILDQWSFVEFVTLTYDSKRYFADYGMLPAVFNTGLGIGEVILEEFSLNSWFGTSAVWDSDGYDPDAIPSEVDPALFNSGADDMEEFDPAEWPEELWEPITVPTPP